MTNRLFFVLILFLVSGYSALGQKIKYKELFVLLNAKDYDNAEPFLKRYLKANDDNPNAYLFMAIIYEYKAGKVDILKETERYVMNLDSAVYFYGMASKGMTEKEVSRNEDYYQMDSRRDFRTGEFGIKLSDVVLRIETGIKLKERAKEAKVLKGQFVASEKAYERSLKLFGTIQVEYPDQKALYLRGGDSLVLKLNRLATIMDSCHMFFNDYKATAKGMGKIGYNQDFDPQDITDFKRELTKADYYSDDIKIQDFKRWALSTTDVIDREIKPLRDQLVARDIELNNLQHQVKRDSVSVRKELAALRSQQFSALIKIDPNPLPLQVFQMKEAELEFGCQVAEDKSVRDSASLALQVASLRKEIVYAKKLDSIAGFLVERDFDAESANYQHFVNTAYGTPKLLKTLVRGTKELALREIIRRESMITKKSEMLRWIVDGADSIPLFLDVPQRSRFRPLVLQDEQFTAGLAFADSVGAGYFYSILPTRKAEIKAVYPVNKVAFKKRFLSVTKALTTHDENGLVYFVLTYQEAKLKDKYQATLTKIYKVEGLAWSMDVVFDQVPIEMTFSIESSEISIKTKSSIGEMFVSTFTRDGKPVK